MRLEGWSNPLDGKRATELNVKLYEAYEAGADAMLEGLKSQAHQDFLALHEGETCKGRWVFIPEEE